MTTALPSPDRLAPLCQRYGVERLEVFGSVARDEATDASDLDLLYTLYPEARLGWEIADFSDELSQLTGREVDLVSRKALHPLIKERVLADAKVIYDASR